VSYSLKKVQFSGIQAIQRQNNKYSQADEEIEVLAVHRRFLA
jgi:hypothetical protein